MTQIKYSVDPATLAYLRWLADNVYFVKSENQAARILMQHRLGELRLNRISDPSASELAALTNEVGGEQSEESDT